MSVLIKGMVMPICRTCPMCDEKLYGDFCKCTGELVSFSFDRGKNCPLVEVPTPHGRLIDVDEFIKKRNLGYECEGCIFDGECNYDFSFTRMELCSWIEDAPTVIERENDNR